MINIAKLLKDAPKGMKLYSPLFGEVNFVGIDKQSGYPINVTDSKGNGKSFTEFGVYFADHPDAECLLFPSKECRTWENFKLPAKSEFKVGDWVVKKDGTTFYGGNYAEQVTLIEVGETGKRIWFSSKTWLWEDGIRLWTIQDAKDGDIIGFNDLTRSDDSYVDWIGIYRQASGTNHHLFHCVIPSCRSFRVGGLWRVFTAYPATKEQRDLLFKKMKEAGYQWDADKKELHKIKPHYNIANFKPFDKVLTRCADDEEWAIEMFSKYYDSEPTIHGRTYRFMCIADSYSQCIPFEGNEHLLGTTDMCDEQYVNW